VCVDTVNSIKSRSAKDHETTYQAILERLRAGSLIHADETKVAIEGADRYVWVFTNLEEVAFVYGNTREAKTPQEVLRDFRGVLVSDFYAAYDGFDCAHQKCLIHLMRDINEDLRFPEPTVNIKDIAHKYHHAELEEEKKIGKSKWKELISEAKKDKGKGAGKSDLGTQHGTEAQRAEAPGTKEPEDVAKTHRAPGPR
jgi:hypothetical protein